MRKHATAAVFLTAALIGTSTTSALAAKPGGGGGGGGGTPSAGVVVALGDSYISGEAGRWSGNSSNNSGSRNGTDRAWVKQGGSGYYDTSLVYLQGTDNDGCHRADVADVHASGATSTINLACSGAVTSNIWRASQGGVSQNGWAPQADQLAALDPAIDIDAIVLSIGGNDLGFSDIIIACTQAWFTSPSWWENHCEPDEQPGVDAKMPTAMANVAKSIDEVNAVMAARGDTDFRLILRSYGSPIPRASENRYPESGWSRWDDGGCPFWNEDSDWARDSLVPQISANLAIVAANKGVEFLDLQDLFEDHEVCSVHNSHVGGGGPNGANHEWIRWLNTGYNQGNAQESLHPNAFGEEAGGNCIEAVLLAVPGNYDCTSAAGAGPDAVTITAS